MIYKSIKYVWLELDFFQETVNFVYRENTVIRKQKNASQTLGNLKTS